MRYDDEEKSEDDKDFDQLTGSELKSDDTSNWQYQRKQKRKTLYLYHKNKLYLKGYKPEDMDKILMEIRKRKSTQL